MKKKPLVRNDSLREARLVLGLDRKHTGNGQLALTLQERSIGVDELLRLETKKPISIFRLQKSCDSLAPAPQFPIFLFSLEIY